MSAGNPDYNRFPEKDREEMFVKGIEHKRKAKMYKTIRRIRFFHALVQSALMFAILSFTLMNRFSYGFLIIMLVCGVAVGLTVVSLELSSLPSGVLYATAGMVTILVSRNYELFAVGFNAIGIGFICLVLLGSGAFVSFWASEDRIKDPPF